MRRITENVQEEIIGKTIANSFIEDELIVIVFDDDTYVCGSLAASGGGYGPPDEHWISFEENNISLLRELALSGVVSESEVESALDKRRVRVIDQTKRDIEILKDRLEELDKKGDNWRFYAEDAVLFHEDESKE